jgi:hypothetical protein
MTLDDMFSSAINVVFGFLFGIIAKLLFDALIAGQYVFAIVLVVLVIGAFLWAIITSWFDGMFSFGMLRSGSNSNAPRSPIRRYAFFGAALLAIIASIIWSPEQIMDLL